MKNKEIVMFMKIVFSGKPTEYDRVGCDGMYVKSCEPVIPHGAKTFNEWWERYGELSASMCNGKIPVFAREIWDAATEAEITK